MGACTGYVSTIFLIAIIVLVRIPLSTGVCDDEERVTIQPNNGYFDITTGQALSGHVISSARISAEGICSIRCVRHPSCKSFNYSPDTETCELNDGNHLLNSDDMVSNASFNYFIYRGSKFKGQFLNILCSVKVGLDKAITKEKVCLRNPCALQ